MIVSLLGLIAAQGMSSFWPGRIEQLTLRKGSGEGLGETDTVVGELRKTGMRQVTQGDRIVEEPESQYYVANRDVYGYAFRYVLDAAVVERSTPADLMLVERMGNGNAIGRPKALERKGKPTLPASDPAFKSELATVIAEAASAREGVRTIERNEIGDINQELSGLREDRRRALRLFRESLPEPDARVPADLVQHAQRGTALPEATAARMRAAHPDAFATLAAKLQEISARETTLDTGYQRLAAQAREARGRLADDTLVLSTPSGAELRIAGGDIVHVLRPNTLGTAGRMGEFLRRGWNFLTEEPREANTEGGIAPAIFGTTVMTVILSILVTPFGVITALYLREYASQGPLVRCVRIAINNLAGVPSIVFGVFGLGFFVYLVGGSLDALIHPDREQPILGTGGMIWCSLTLALMTLPVVIVAAEEAIASVPRGMREASLALGASKWQTIRAIVLPASAPGILTGMILAMARGAGEVAPLMLVGVVKMAPELPLDGEFPFVHLERKIMHLGFHIYDLGFQSPDSDAAIPMVFSTTFLLIALVVTLNLAAILIRERLKAKYKTDSL